MNGNRPPLVVGLGESLLRLSSPGHDRLGQAGHLDVHVGGAEMNALIAAAASGLEARWLTRLADNPLGRRIAAHAAMHGVEAVVDWDDRARAPLYFVEHGHPPRPSEVLYDRDLTAMRALTPETFGLHDLLRGAATVLSTGITCALGEGPTEAVRQLLAQARNGGAVTAFDINHRSRMWDWDQAAPVLRKVLPGVDLLFANGHDLAHLLDRRDTRTPAIDLAYEALDRFGHDLVVLRDTAQTAPARVAVTVEAVTADDVVRSGPYEADIVDAFGAGDAAVGVFLAALTQTKDVAQAVDEAGWACAFQHTVTGDAWQGRPGDLQERRSTNRRIRR